MGKSSILGGEKAANFPEGRDIERLGPSDSSDSGSDVMGLDLPGDTDAAGTGERPSVEPGEHSDGADILPDRVSTRDPDARGAGDNSDVENIVEDDVDIEDSDVER